MCVLAMHLLAVIDMKLAVKKDTQAGGGTAEAGEAAGQPCGC